MLFVDIHLLRIGKIGRVVLINILFIMLKVILAQYFEIHGFDFLNFVTSLISFFASPENVGLGLFHLNMYPTGGRHFQNQTSTHRCDLRQKLTTHRTEHLWQSTTHRSDFFLVSIFFLFFFLLC